MNSLLSFENQQVEVLEVNGTIYFNPYHIANILDIKNVRDNLRTMNENQVIKLTQSIVGNADIRKLHSTGELFLTESGVYKLIFKSRKPNAEKFADWVTDEVLPTIRKTGKYEVKPQPQSLIRKTFKGKLVMTYADISKLAELSTGAVSFALRANRWDYDIIARKDLQTFIEQSKGAVKKGTTYLAIVGKDSTLKVLKHLKAPKKNIQIAVEYFREEPKKELPKPLPELQKPVTCVEVELALKILALMPDSDFKDKACQSLLYDVMGKRIFQNIDFLLSTDLIVEDLKALPEAERERKIHSRETQDTLNDLSERGRFLLKRELDRVTLS